MVPVLCSTKEYTGTSNPNRKKENKGGVLKTVIRYKTFYMSFKHFTKNATNLLQCGNNIQKTGSLMLLQETKRGTSDQLLPSNYSIEVTAFFRRCFFPT